MDRRPTAKFVAILAIGTATLAACAPKSPPPPPPPSLCGSTSSTVTNYGAFVTDKKTGEPDVVEFEAHDKAEVDAKVKDLEKTKKVHAVSPDQPVHSLAVNPGDDPRYPEQWGFGSDEADFPGAWNDPSGPNGAGVRVAVVDTGVQATVPDLMGRVLQGKDFVYGDSSSNFGRKDGDGHGTHVSGTIAANDNTQGVVGGAPLSWIVPVRVLNCNGSGTTTAVANGITWAADPTKGNADVISLSLGGGAASVEQTAINYALGKGVTVVAAAGNNGPGGSLNYPGAYPGVIAVAAKARGADAVHFDGGYVSTPDTDGTGLPNGTMSFTARIEPETWRPSSTEVIASKLEPGVGGYEPLALNPDGSLTFSTESASVTSPILDVGGRRWLWVHRFNGKLEFRTADDGAGTPGGSWVPVPDAVDLGAGGTVSTAHTSASALAGATTMELILRVRADDWTPATTQVLASKFDAGTHSGYELALNPNGTLKLIAGRAGLQPDVNVDSPFVIPTTAPRQWLRVIRQTSGSTSTVSFNWVHDLDFVPGGWQDLGTVTVPNNWAEPFAVDPSGTVPLVLGNGPTPTQGLQGSILYGAVRPTVGSGDWTVTMDASVPPAGAASWQNGTAETWFVQAPAAVREGATTVPTGPFTDSTVSFTVGARPDGSRPFHGFVLQAAASPEGSPPAIDFDPHYDASLGVSSWAAQAYPDNLTWTVAAGAQVTGSNAPYSNTNGYVAVIAPGTDVISTLKNSSYGYLTGTSMATPHVTALVALLLQKCFGPPLPANLPASTPANVRAWITNTSFGPFAGFSATNETDGTPVGLMRAGAAYEAACP